MELISIIIPIYNVEEYLKKCVDSVLNQTYTSLEIILVDDGSPDQCGKICDEYEKKDDRIVVIHKKNGGLSDARNYGLHVCKGKYVVFLDSDDYITENCIEQMYRALKLNDADMSICNFSYVNELGEVCAQQGISPIESVVYDSSVVFSCKATSEYYWYWVVAWNKMYSRKLLSDMEFRVGKLHEDEFFFNELFAKKFKIAGVKNSLYYYLQRTGSIMSNLNDPRRLDRVEALFERCSIYNSHDLPSENVYKTLMRGLYILRNYMDSDNCEVKRKIKKLKNQFNMLSLNLLKKDLKIKFKIILVLNVLFPYSMKKIKNIRK